MGTDWKLRPFRKEIDYPIVSKWWGANPVHPSCLTDTGVFAIEGGAEVACAWLLVDNRSPVARVVHVIIDPAYRGENEGLAHVLNYFQREAENIGKTFTVDMPFDGSSLATLQDKPGDFLDRCHAAMTELPEAYYETQHTFTPGLYSRQIFIPAGTLCMSKIHKTKHPYVISKGEISVWTAEGGAVRLKAPHSGITQPGTRRLLFAHDDTIWTTFHAGPWATVEEFEANIIEPHSNPYLEAKK